MIEKQSPPSGEPVQQAIAEWRIVRPKKLICRTPTFRARLLAGVALSVVTCLVFSDAQLAEAQILSSQNDVGTQQQGEERRSFFGRLFDRLLGREAEANDIDVLPVPDGIAYSVAFDIPKDSPAEQLEKVSELARLQKQLPSGAMGLIARANADKRRLISGLDALGFFNGRVDITIAGVGLENPGLVSRIEVAHRSGPVPVQVVVIPGNQYVFGKFALINAITRQPLPSPDWSKLDIKAGDPALSASVLSAETALVGYFRDQGYAKARIPARQATVDHARRVMDVVFHVDVGPLTKFGPVTVSGTKNLDLDFITERVPFKEGDVFSPEAVARLRSELGAYSVFDSVRIIEADHLTANNELPIEVRVGERLPRFVGFSAKYSTTDGPATDVYWGHRNLFGGAEQLRLEAQLSAASIDTVNGRSRAHAKDKLGYHIGGNFLKPGIFTVKDDLVIEAAGLKEITKTFTRHGFIGSVDVKRTFSDELTGQVGVDVEWARYTAPTNMYYIYRGWYTLVGIPVQADFDNTGDLLNPTKGIKLSGKVTPYPAFLGSSVSMTKLDTTLSGYLPLDDDARYVLAARARFGSIIGPALPNIPPPHRFFAGGGGSIRGYDYQSLGPTDASGFVIGGRSLFEGSGEMRVKITDTIGLVAFSDMGMAFRSSTPSFKESLRYSAGLGLRYYTSIGPIRLDLARGLNREPGDPPYGLYISLGQSF